MALCAGPRFLASLLPTCWRSLIMDQIRLRSSYSLGDPGRRWDLFASVESRCTSAESSCSLRVVTGPVPSVWSWTGPFSALTLAVLAPGRACSLGPRLCLSCSSAERSSSLFAPRSLRNAFPSCLSRTILCSIQLWPEGGPGVAFGGGAGVCRAQVETSQ